MIVISPVKFGQGRASRWRAGEGDAIATGLESVGPDLVRSSTGTLPFRFEVPFTVGPDERPHRCVLYLQAVAGGERGWYRVAPVAIELAAASPMPIESAVVAGFPLDEALIRAILTQGSNSDGSPLSRAQAIELLGGGTQVSLDDRRRRVAHAYFQARHGERRAAAARELGLRPEEPADLQAAAQFVYRAKKTPIWAEVAATYEGES